jgi:uncharacterized membrane protein
MRARQWGWVLGTLISLLACGDSKSSGEEEGTLSGATCPTDSKVTYDEDIKPFMAKYCTTCHDSSLSGNARHDAPDDHNFETMAGIVEEAHHIDTHAASGPDATNTAMPPAGYPAPSKAERAKLGEWLACNSDVGAEDDD